MNSLTIWQTHPVSVNGPPMAVLQCAREDLRGERCAALQGFSRAAVLRWPPESKFYCNKHRPMKE